MVNGQVYLHVKSIVDRSAINAKNTVLLFKTVRDIIIRINPMRYSCSCIVCCAPVRYKQLITHKMNGIV